MGLRYSVIIPVYNSVESVNELTTRIEKVFGELGESFEIIYINDYSPNPSVWPNLKRLAAENTFVKSIHLMRNFGKPGAIFCGFQYAVGQYIITMDDDLQHLPEEIPKLIAKQDHDVVIAQFPQKKHSAFKRITSRWKAWFDYKFIHKPKHVYNSPYKLIRREVIDAVKGLNTSHPYVSAMLFTSTASITNVMMEHAPRKYGKTGYTLGKMIKQFSNLLINNSSFLLQLISYMGFLLALISFGLGAYLIFKKIFIGTSVSGWTSLMAVLLFTGGMVLLALGVVGEYLIRIVSGIERKPSFIVREKSFEA